MTTLTQQSTYGQKSVFSQVASKLPLVILALFAYVTADSAWAEATPDCMSEEVMRTRMSQEGLVEQIRSVQVSVDPAKKAEWDKSMHDFGGQSMSGAGLYKILSIQTDRDNYYAMEAKLREQGMRPYAIEKGMSEMKEYAELKMKERFLTISSECKQFFLFAGKAVGAVVNQKSGAACIVMRLQNPIVQHFSLGLPPAWLKKSSKLPVLIAAYRKENGFGVAAFSKTTDGDSLVILAKPQLGLGSTDGPVPYYFGGVMLLERQGGEIAILGDLMHTKYVENYSLNSARR